MGDYLIFWLSRLLAEALWSILVVFFFAAIFVIVMVVGWIYDKVMRLRRRK